MIAFWLVIAACGQPPTPSSATSKSTPSPTKESTPAAASTRNEKERDAVAALVGTTPPEWQLEKWMSSPPLTLASLRGSVVLVRWWTSGCPFCSASAPALRTFHRSYAERGLKVIGVYHHKEETPFDPKVYEDTAREYQFTFPVAFDPSWRAFEAWMRDRDGKKVDTGWTSVTFVLDKHGVVRHVHPGGQYVDGEAGHSELVAAIERLLAEK